ASPEPEVVIQVITQFVNAPRPSFATEKATPTPAPIVEEKKTEPAPAVVKTILTPAVTSTIVAETPTPNTPNAALAETNSAAATPPPTPTTVANEANNGATPLGPNRQNMTAWLFLAGGILTLLVGIAAIRRLISTRPGETSMISQSLERRDNG
ncbi:MAG: hypothetical protein ACPGVU_17110, partial [Limisphaerales bacterium]